MRRAALFLACAALAGCGEHATVPDSAGYGSQPTLPAPHATALPTIKVAKAIGWGLGAHPIPAAGLQVSAFAAGLDHPRWLTVLPNGDVLVAETNAPPKPEDSKGLAGVVEKVVMTRAGARTPSANRITLLRDTRGTGAADVKTVFLKGLNSPFGMTLVGDALYVADTDAVLRFPYATGATRITAAGTKVVDLPAGPINHHWTKNVVASPDGRMLYASVGSNSNVGENGLVAEAGRAAIWRIDPATGAHGVFASGLRNPVGMGFEPVTGKLWTSVNERDEIGSDLVPDYMTSVAEGGFYGWPFSYYGRHVDTRVKAQRPDLVARALVPDYALGAHTASLGLAFAAGAKALPPAFREGVFIGQHGSWNRKPMAGYRVIFVPFAGGRPSGPPVEVLTGFLTPAGEAQGRPVGVAMARDGALLVADDVGNTVWRVTAR
ncbi:MAG: sorbosone dehydrogenase family protein [Sphingomonadaceae bacterium]|nr:sorbosone dehydrogenase family protein [Sphingomonadaceae bacterium]